MSDSYHIICSTKEILDSKSKSEEIKRWLQTEGIIEAVESNSVLSGKKYGYKPGSNYLRVVQYDENTTRLKVCGAEFQMEREVFNAGALNVESKIICPKCHTDRFEELTPLAFYTEQLSSEQLKLYDSMFKKFDQWMATEPAILECPKCQGTSDISEYSIEGNLCLANFGITFWNWPPFKTEFLAEFTAKLGTEIKVITGHI